MKSDHPAKLFLAAFLLALVVYVTFYAGIEHRRARKGPWEVAFTTNSDGSPAILINQPKLAITNVQIGFPGQSLLATNSVDTANSAFTNHERLSGRNSSPVTGNQLPLTLLFNQPRAVPYEVPFGQCLFADLTFLPGTVTFKLFGHEIELLPRVLVIDGQEHPWRSNSNTTLARVPESPAQTAPGRL